MIRPRRRTPREPPGPSLARRRLDTRPDAPDFRDLLYVPTLVEVAPVRPLEVWLELGVPVLDQGVEGACTGHALATVVHALLRTRRVQPEATRVSARMLYEMARRYDEWPGEDHEGSSCRGAMKGWHKHGVCAEEMWPHRLEGGEAGQPAPTGRRRKALAPGTTEDTLTAERELDALQRPLGAYFRVNHRDLVAMHAALSETGVLLACALLHAGWDRVGADGRVPFGAAASASPTRRQPGPVPEPAPEPHQPAVFGAHAFAIVGYDAEGFWFQNSWGEGWGWRGCGHIAYEDWLRHGYDVWVGRLGAPAVSAAKAAARLHPTGAEPAVARGEAQRLLRPHVVSLGNDGRLRPGGALGSRRADVRRIMLEDFALQAQDWPRQRLVLYAHGGLVSEGEALQRLAGLRAAMLAQHCYPLAFVWKTDLLTTLGHILHEAGRKRRSEGVLGTAADFMLDRLDDALEPLARHLGGRAVWEEMKENALAATEDQEGGARLALQHLVELAAALPELEIHLVAHSAGSVLLAPALTLLTTPRAAGGLGLSVASCTLWAPACTMALFEAHYLSALEAGRLQRLALYTLTEHAEQADHCMGLYHKSLLWLVSNALEEQARIPLLRPEGMPLAGLASHLQGHARVRALAERGLLKWVLSPNARPEGLAGAAATTEHGGFDDDGATLGSTLSFIREGG